MAPTGVCRSRAIGIRSGAIEKRSTVAVQAAAGARALESQLRKEAPVAEPGPLRYPINVAVNGY